MNCIIVEWLTLWLEVRSYKQRNIKKFITNNPIKNIVAYTNNYASQSFMIQLSWLKQSKYYYNCLLDLLLIYFTFFKNIFN